MVKSNGTHPSCGMQFIGLLIACLSVFVCHLNCFPLLGYFGFPFSMSCSDYNISRDTKCVLKRKPAGMKGLIIMYLFGSNWILK